MRGHERSTDSAVARERRAAGVAAERSHPRPAGSVAAGLEVIERRHPRVRVNLPVEMRSGLMLALGTTADLSEGGMLLASPVRLDREPDLWLRFNLPNGYSVRTRGRIVHIQPDGRLGVSFEQLSPNDRFALAEALQRLLGYTRRGERRPKRVHVTVRPVGSLESEQEIAETVLISQHGGLLLSRAHLRLLDRVTLAWPERRRSATARIVFRRPAGPGGLAEFGFTFEDDDNFWEL